MHAFERQIYASFLEKARQESELGKERIRELPPDHIEFQRGKFPNNDEDLTAESTEISPETFSSKSFPLPDLR